MDNNLEDMTRQELRKYMLENRGNPEKLDRAIAESKSRPGWTKVPADMPIEEQLNILGRAISQEN